jgi:hypothetical protein
MNYWSTCRCIVRCRNSILCPGVNQQNQKVLTFSIAKYRRSNGASGYSHGNGPDGIRELSDTASDQVVSKGTRLVRNKHRHLTFDALWRSSPTANAIVCLTPKRQMDCRHYQAHPEQQEIFWNKCLEPDLAIEGSVSWPDYQKTSTSQ